MSVEKKISVEEFNAQCDYWYQQEHLTDDELRRNYATREVIGIYYPKEQLLYPWGITPSREDKGYSSI